VRANALAHVRRSRSTRADKCGIHPLCSSWATPCRTIVRWRAAAVLVDRRPLAAEKVWTVTEYVSNGNLYAHLVCTRHCAAQRAYAARPRLTHAGARTAELQAHLGAARSGGAAGEPARSLHRCRAAAVTNRTTQVCQAMNYLHSSQPPFVHGALSSANVLVRLQA
jgi:hypothetical protein